MGHAAEAGEAYASGAAGEALAAQRAHIRSGMSLGQVHRPGPVAAHQLGQIDRLDK